MSHHPLQVTLRTPDGDLTLDRARVLEELEEYDLDHNRPPFSTHVFSEGTGKRLPTLIPVSVRVRGATMQEADILLERLEAAAADCSLIIRGNRQRTTAGLTGELTISPTLMGYRVDFNLAATGEWTRPTGGTLAFNTSNNSQYLGIL